MPGRAAGRLTGYPLACSLGGLLGGLAGLCCAALLVGRSLPVMVARPIAWHLVLGSLVTGSLVGGTLWWLHHLATPRPSKRPPVVRSRAELLRVRIEPPKPLSPHAAASRSSSCRPRSSRTFSTTRWPTCATSSGRRPTGLRLSTVRALFPRRAPELARGGGQPRAEIELCEAFGAIQALRIGGLLRLDVEAADDLRAARLPPAVVLTLVENAFKHGVPPSGAVAHVTIAARRVGAQLHVSVVDNGCRSEPSPRAGEPGSGMGLRWLAERLQAVHGDRAAVRLEHLPAGGCRAHITLPFDTGFAA